MRRVREICAIPLWMNGRACLKITRDFCDVLNPVTGEMLRRTPLFGVREADEAIRSAGNGLAAWLAQGEIGRKHLISSLGDAVHGLDGHFSALIADETGKEEAQADADVLNIVSVLREPGMAVVSGVAVLSAGTRGLLEVVAQAASALAAGATLVLCPSPESPSALFALAELSGRCGFPAGVINVLYLSDDALVGLRRIPGITLLT